jgi:hypothetical protein
MAMNMSGSTWCARPMTIAGWGRKCRQVRSLRSISAPRPASSPNSATGLRRRVSQRCDAGDHAAVTRDIVAGPLSQSGCAGISRPDPVGSGERSIRCLHTRPLRPNASPAVASCLAAPSPPVHRPRKKLLRKVVAHAAHDHGVTEVTPELAAKVKAAIKSQ